jgi:16S rRNA processing protein RimM
VGKIVRPHGVRGEVVVNRFGREGDPLAPGSVVTARSGTEGRAEAALRVESRRPSSRGRWLVVFEGIEDRDQAAVLSGSIIGVDESSLPDLEEGRYYNFQVVGLEAVTPEGESLGTVREVWETGANDVFVVRGPKGEILLPVIAAVIREFDWEGGRVTVTPLPGLIPEEP